MTHRRVGKLLGTLREGSTIHEPPLALKAKGVVYIAAHPDETPLLITPWGIKPLTFIRAPEPVRRAVDKAHSIHANPPR
jgi:hypothetical protein